MHVVSDPLIRLVIVMELVPGGDLLDKIKEIRYGGLGMEIPCALLRFLSD